MCVDWIGIVRLDVALLQPAHHHITEFWGCPKHEVPYAASSKGELLWYVYVNLQNVLALTELLLHGGCKL